ncbi:hypothetical protein [Frondihabitans sp. PhB188]|uniref:hypothetical protein n=1 Tax=Frondihabitans sp. PhB188 TaxID=2485200 RepID=UPI0011CEAF61|nr:hypothetical protein [Frondihabitans sp. PhB188]
MPTPTPRVREIDGPDDWVDLDETYPFDIIGQKQGTWWQTTRIDDSWFIPDWAAVATDFDVIHLTGMGYLTTAGRPLAVEGGHTLMAGFSPDESFWLTDSFHFPEPGIDWEPIPSGKIAAPGLNQRALFPGSPVAAFDRHGACIPCP